MRRGKRSHGGAFEVGSAGMCRRFLAWRLQTRSCGIRPDDAPKGGIWPCPVGARTCCACSPCVEAPALHGQLHQRLVRHAGSSAIRPARGLSPDMQRCPLESEARRLAGARLGKQSPEVVDRRRCRIAGGTWKDETLASHVRAWPRSWREPLPKGPGGWFQRARVMLVAG